MSSLRKTPTQKQYTREELVHQLTANIHDEDKKRAFLRDRSVALSLDVCHAVQARQQRCGHNAEDGYGHLCSLGYDVRIALGFMVEHEYWHMQVIEHVWLVVRDGDDEYIVDPTLPFLCITQLPTYFEGAVRNDDLPYPDLRNRAYKAAFLKAKHLAETCEYPFMETAKRRVHIGRMNWVEGLDVAEGRVR